MFKLSIEDKFIVDQDITSNIMKQITEREHENLLSTIVEHIQWIASVRPQETGIASYEDDVRRFEEVQLFEVAVNSAENIYPISRIIMTKVAYPVILLVRFDNKYRVAISKPAKSKREYGEIVIRSHFQTFYFFPHEPEISSVTDGIIQALNFSKYSCSNIFELHSKIFNSLLDYKTRGLPRAKVCRVIDWLGLKYGPDKKHILNECTPTKYHPPKYVINGYAPERLSSYLLLHDWEDVWHALMRNDNARRKIEHHRIKNMEELLYCSDEY